MFFRLLKLVLLGCVLLAAVAPVNAQEWTRYSSYDNDNGDTVLMYLDPASVKRVDRSVFVWTFVEDPADQGTRGFGTRDYLEINQSRIRHLKTRFSDGKVEDHSDPEWISIDDGTTDFDLYKAAVDVLKSRE